MALLYSCFAFAFPCIGFGAEPAVDASKDKEKTPALSYRIVGRYPHDIHHFTEGLEIQNGKLWESTGGYGESGVYLKELRTGKVVSQTTMPTQLFGEGLTQLGQRLIVLTWREGLGLVYNLNLQLISGFRLKREGWGLTRMPQKDGPERLLMSDGSSSLHLLDGESFKEIGEIPVADHGLPVTKINELEYDGSVIYANVWTTDKVAVIQPNGQVKAWLDLSALSKDFDKPPTWNAQEHVLNGLAHDPKTGHLFVTGKCWPYLYELAVGEGRVSK